MIITPQTAELRRQLAPMRGRERIALVPTMGCLHEGHLSLIRKARRLADTVVVSIYVNPLQFGPNEDLDSYPRTFEADAALCETEDVDIIFHPQNLYADGPPPVSLCVAGLDRCLCGTARPGHFDGVATVVAILFNIVQPDLAVFGEKDWQQLTIIRRMTEGLYMPLEIVAGDTVREADGLAMSSRNRYLNPAERRRATGLYRALSAMQKLAKAGETCCATLVAHGRERLAAQDIEAEYLDIRDAWSLEPVANLSGNRSARALVAARIGRARLIDNVPMPHASAPVNHTEPEEVSR